MADDCTGPDDIPLPAFLRGARTAYGSAMRAALTEVGCDDVPANGMYVIGALARLDIPLGQIVRELRISKQAAGQLVDTLVLRGYLERETDPSDRRRLTLTLTERGKAAAAAQRSAVDRVDAELRKRVGPDYIAHTRATLGALIDIHGERERAASQ